MQGKGTETSSDKGWPEGGYNHGTIASDWFPNEYGILRITKLIGIVELYVYYVYNANWESALPLAIYSIDLCFTILKTINGSWQCDM
jgi:hypothetical protein